MSREYESLIVFNVGLTITMRFSEAATAPSGNGGANELTGDIEISSDSNKCKKENKQ